MYGGDWDESLFLIITECYSLMLMCDTFKE